ncbi:hypothetical protein EV421DRAFT_1924840 [Armillaria borealis]|uniref:Uncharacterized protein n=1 Tax=Armillaria borealis TaxID=47425 RepID=A0AA39IY53_9AGAR|nr:hypothetical protein EV421DRAFT_1924840 [Armillaria borealis]
MVDLGTKHRGRVKIGSRTMNVDEGVVDVHVVLDDGGRQKGTVIRVSDRPLRSVPRLDTHLTFTDICPPAETFQDEQLTIKYYWFRRSPRYAACQANSDERAQRPKLGLSVQSALTSEVLTNPKVVDSVTGARISSSISGVVLDWHGNADVSKAAPPARMLSSSTCKPSVPRRERPRQPVSFKRRTFKLQTQIGNDDDDGERRRFPTPNLYLGNDQLEVFPLNDNCGFSLLYDVKNITPYKTDVIESVYYDSSSFVSPYSSVNPGTGSLNNLQCLLGSVKPSFFLPTPLSNVRLWLPVFYTGDLIVPHATKQMKIEDLAERIVDVPGLSLFSRKTMTAKITLMPLTRIRGAGGRAGFASDISVTANVLRMTQVHNKHSLREDGDERLQGELACWGPQRYSVAPVSAVVSSCGGDWDVQLNSPVSTPQKFHYSSIHFVRSESCSIIPGSAQLEFSSEYHVSPDKLKSQVVQGELARLREQVIDDQTNVCSLPYMHTPSASNVTGNWDHFLIATTKIEHSEHWGVGIFCD